MKIGYPCINLTLDCRSSSTFRLNSFTPERFLETVRNNLACLRRILEFNVEHHLLFFRITSDLIPFASHPVNQVDWVSYFRDEFTSIGEYIRRHDIRISMHPDQFVLLNSPKQDVVKNSLAELKYHAKVLDALELDTSAKIQIHIGGVYGDRDASLGRFVEAVHRLDSDVRRRLVVENDDRLYSLEDCLTVSALTGLPVLFDVFHHAVLNNGEPIERAFDVFTITWRAGDGIPMVDYSSQQPGGRKGKHAESIDLDQFEHFVSMTRCFDFDVMLEIKDKDISAQKVIELLVADDRIKK